MKKLLVAGAAILAVALAYGAGQVFYGPGGAIVYDVAQPTEGPPITSMRPNKIFIDNTKIPVGKEGIDYAANTAVTTASFPTLITGGDTPVTTNGTLRPANCNQPWIGGYGVNRAAFTASMGGTTTLTVSAKSAGTIVPGNPGQVIPGLGGAKILSQLTGTTGGVGTYHMSISASFGSLPLESVTNACQRNAGNFRTVVEYVGMAYVDPIVKPGLPGQTHLHTFFGNTFINAWATNDGGARSLQLNGKSAASGGIMNRSQYWIPTMIYSCPTAYTDISCDASKDGTPIVPTIFQIYYKGAHGDGSFTNDGTNDNPWNSQIVNDIQPWPAGFRMLAGNPTADGTSDQPHIRWGCFSYLASPNPLVFHDGGHIPGSGQGATDACTEAEATPLNTTYVGGFVRNNVNFASCRNAVDLDSPDHVSHVSYPGVGMDSTQCPSPNTVQTPGIEYIVDYYFTTLGHDPVTLKGLADVKFWRLSSDNYSTALPAGRSAHGDWFQAWDQAVMTAWVTDCLIPGTDCHDNVAGSHPSNTSHPIIDTWNVMSAPRRGR